MIYNITIGKYVKRSKTFLMSSMCTKHVFCIKIYMNYVSRTFLHILKDILNFAFSIAVLLPCAFLLFLVVKKTNHKVIKEGSKIHKDRPDDFSSFVQCHKTFYSLPLFFLLCPNLLIPNINTKSH